MKTTNKMDDVLFHVGLFDFSICINKKLSLLGLAPPQGTWIVASKKYHKLTLSI
jgi:hypothetical protein